MICGEALPIRRLLHATFCTYDNTYDNSSLLRTPPHKLEQVSKHVKRDYHVSYEESLKIESV